MQAASDAHALGWVWGASGFATSPRATRRRSHHGERVALTDNRRMHEVRMPRAHEALEVEAPRRRERTGLQAAAPSYRARALLRGRVRASSAMAHARASAS